MGIQAELLKIGWKIMTTEPVWLADDPNDPRGVTLRWLSTEFHPDLGLVARIDRRQQDERRARVQGLFSSIDFAVIDEDGEVHLAVDAECVDAEDKQKVDQYDKVILQAFQQYMHYSNRPADMRKRPDGIIVIDPSSNAGNNLKEVSARELLATSDNIYRSNN